MHTYVTTHTVLSQHWMSQHSKTLRGTTVCTNDSTIDPASIEEWGIFAFLVIPSVFLFVPKRRLDSLAPKFVLVCVSFLLPADKKFTCTHARSHVHSLAFDHSIPLYAGQVYGALVRAQRMELSKQQLSWVSHKLITVALWVWLWLCLRRVKLKCDLVVAVSVVIVSVGHVQSAVLLLLLLSWWQAEQHPWF